MGEVAPILTGRGFTILVRFILAFLILTMVSVGLWMLNQVIDSVSILGRSFVDVPGYPAQVSVWTYHDAAYGLLWISYVILVLWEITPWKPGRITSGRVVIALFGFALLTAGLWISQDLMNAVLALHRTSVDLPFFVTSLDLYQTRDLVVLLSALSYISFFVLTRIARAD